MSKIWEKSYGADPLANTKFYYELMRVL